MRQRTYGYTTVIFAVGVALFLINLGTMTIDIMEARNFVTVREILLSGDWLHPKMNGVLRLEKPPLPTWITAIFASIFGFKSLFFLRLPAALMSLWMLFSMHALVKRITGDKLLGMLSALGLAAMLYVILMGRRGTWDIYTHSFMLTAILQFVAMFQSVKPLRRALLGGVLFGAAFLSKGPVAAYTLFIPFLLAYIGYYRPLFGVDKRGAMFVYIVFAILISVSWFAFIHIALGDTAREVIAKEVNNWHSYNTRPWYYYLKDYPVHSGVWTAILAMGLLTPYTFNKMKDKKAFRFFWMWTVGSLILLSIVPEKKIRYLLPTFIPAAFLVAAYLYYLIKDYEIQKKRLDKIVFAMHWSIFLLTPFALPLLTYVLFYTEGIVGWKTLLGLSCCCLFCLYLFIKAWKRGKKHYLIIGIMGILFSAILFVLPNTDRVANQNFDSISEVGAMKDLEGIPCYALEETRIELVWLLGREIQEVQTLENLQPPYILLTNNVPEIYMPNKKFQFIGLYDNNSKSKGHRHYEQSLTKHVSLVW